MLSLVPRDLDTRHIPRQSFTHPEAHPSSHSYRATALAADLYPARQKVVLNSRKQ